MGKVSERALKLWISIRTSNGDKAIFTTALGERLSYTMIAIIVKEASIDSGVGKDTNDLAKPSHPMSLDMHSPRILLEIAVIPK